MTAAQRGDGSAAAAAAAWAAVNLATLLLLLRPLLLPRRRRPCCCDVRVRRRSRRIPSRSPLLFDTNEIRWSFVIYIQILFILVFTLSYYIGERERSTQTTGKAPNVLMPLLRVGADDDVDRVVSGAEEGTFKGGKDDFISVSRENEEEVKHVGLTD